MIDHWECEHGIKHWMGESCDCDEPEDDEDE